MCVGAELSENNFLGRKYKNFYVMQNLNLK